MRLSALAAVLAAIALSGCGTEAPRPIAEPPEVDLSGVDPEVARLLSDLQAKVAAAPAGAAERAALGMAYEVNGFPLAAERCYEQAAGLDPREPRWPYFLALARAARGDIPAALQSIATAIALEPDYVPARLSAGAWQLAADQVEDALRSFTDARRVAPDDPWARLWLARVHLRAGRAAAAIAILEPLSAEPGADPHVLRILGTAYREVGDETRARVALARGRPAAPRPWPDPWSQAKRDYLVGFGARVLRAEERLAAGRAAEALPDLEALHAERPDEPAVVTSLSIALQAAGRADDAHRLLEAAVERQPRQAVLRLNLAASYERQGDTARALDQLDAILAVDPQQADAHVRRGLILSRTGHKEEALRAFDAGAAAGAGDPQPWLYAGIQAAELGRFAEARERLERVVALDPAQFEAWATLGPIRARLGDREGSAAALERAAEIRPDDPRLAQARARAAANLAGAR